MIEFIQILLDINILPKFGADWSIFADDKSVNKVKYGKFTNSRADNSDSSGPIRSVITHPRSYNHMHFDQVLC